MNKIDMNQPCDLYRWFDKDDNLLYVGISINAYNRAKQHRDQADWWDDAAKMTIEKFENRLLASDAEVLAIQNENPKHNKQRYSKKNKKREWISFQDIWNKGLKDGLTPNQMNNLISQAQEIYYQLRLADLND